MIKSICCRFAKFNNLKHLLKQIIHSPVAQYAKIIKKLRYKKKIGKLLTLGAQE